VSDAVTEPLALSSSARRATLIDVIAPRGLTLDSDVTSLLRREVSAAAAEPQATNGANPVPLQDRRAFVQIVRGTDSRAIALGAIEPGSQAAAAPVAPATPPTAD
jgi:hypothetical protein